MPRYIMEIKKNVEQEEQELWEIPEKALDRIISDRESIEFYMREAERAKDYLLDIQNKITARFYTLLSIVIGLAGLLLAFPHNSKANSLITTILVIIYGIIAIYLIVNVMPFQTAIKGLEPKRYLTTDIINAYRSTEPPYEAQSHRIKCFYIKVLQRDITEIKTSNLHRAKSFSVALWAVISSFLLIAMLLVLRIWC
jgi:hypothetical protein